MGTKHHRFAQPQSLNERFCPKCKKYVVYNPFQIRNIEQELTTADGPTRIDRVSYITCPNCHYKYFEVGRKTIRYK